MFFLSEKLHRSNFRKINEREQLSDFRQYHRGGKRQVRTKFGYLIDINALPTRLSPKNALNIKKLTIF